jgi:hypothetical protein
MTSSGRHPLPGYEPIHWNVDPRIWSYHPCWKKESVCWIRKCCAYIWWI